MSSGKDPGDADFGRNLADRVAELRLQVDMGELRTTAEFRRALEHDGRFSMTDPRVREACVRAGLARWLIEAPPA